MDLNTQELDWLNDLKKSFIDSITYIDEILVDKDVLTNLGYIVHDWLGDHGNSYNRNSIIKTQLTHLAESLDRIEALNERITI